VSFVFYCAIAVLEVGVLNWQDLGRSASPLKDLAARVFQNAALTAFLSFSALAATTSVVLSSITGGTRAGFAMGRDGLLPRPLERVSSRLGTPYVSIIFSGTLIAVLAGAFYRNIDLIASIFNFGSLFTYTFVQLSLLRLRRMEPTTRRPFKVPLYPFLPLAGAASCLVLMLYLSTTAKLASLVWLVVGLAVFAFMNRRGGPNAAGHEPGDSPTSGATPEANP
jgi:APA family basic amino acid/polyamine antiporter